MNRLQIRDSFWLMLAIVIFLDTGGLLPVFLTAAAVHEAGHWLAIRLCGGRIQIFQLNAGGGIMRYTLRRSSRLRDVWIALAGPLAGLLLAGAANRLGFYMLSGASLLLSGFNLLPIPPLDGGRAWASLCPNDAMQRAVSTFFAVCVLLLGLYAGWRQNGWGLCLMGLFLTLSQQAGLQSRPIRSRI